MWIESHQALGAHPKTRKLAHILGISRVTAVGHLHYFWWWAMDYAQDGSLARFEPLDIAVGAEWGGDPEAFVSALVQAGFVDGTGHDDQAIHDWDQYGGKLLAKRRGDAERKRVQRTSDGHPSDVQWTSIGHDADVRVTAQVEERRRDKSRGEERNRATQVHPDWEPSAETRKVLAAEGFTERNMDKELVKFRDHFIGKGEAKKNWDATFRNWMRNSVTYGHVKLADREEDRPPNPHPGEWLWDAKHNQWRPPHKVGWVG